MSVWLVKRMNHIKHHLRCGGCNTHTHTKRSGASHPRSGSTQGDDERLASPVCYWYLNPMFTYSNMTVSSAQVIAAVTSPVATTWQQIKYWKSLHCFVCVCAKESTQKKVCWEMNVLTVPDTRPQIWMPTVMNEWMNYYLYMAQSACWRHQAHCIIMLELGKPLHSPQKPPPEKLE